MNPTQKLAGKLTTAKRKKLKSSTFGRPTQRKYPVNDREHAALAKSYARKELDRGNLSQSQFNQIVAKANKKLGASN